MFCLKIQNAARPAKTEDLIGTKVFCSPEHFDSKCYREAALHFKIFPHKLTSLPTNKLPLSPKRLLTISHINILNLSNTTRCVFEILGSNQGFNIL